MMLTIATEAAESVFTPGAGQEYELGFFMAAAVLTLVVGAGLIFVIVKFGNQSPDVADGDESRPREGDGIGRLDPPASASASPESGSSDH